MIARNRLAFAMAAAFTDAELEAMRIAVQHEQSTRATAKDRKAAAKRAHEEQEELGIPGAPPVPREHRATEPAAPSARRVKKVAGTRS